MTALVSRRRHVGQSGRSGRRNRSSPPVRLVAATKASHYSTTPAPELRITGLPKHRRPKASAIHLATTQDLVQRDFLVQAPDQVSMTDVTGHPTREGKVYCCVVLYAWSRRVVGRSLDRRPTAAMVNSALGMAIEARCRTSATLITATTVPPHAAVAVVHEALEWLGAAPDGR